MSHMQQQITSNQAWIKVDTSNGIVYLDASLLGLNVRDSQPKTHPLTAKERETSISRMSQYCEGTIEEWETIRGYGARLSAPGYMDCTEWTVFDTAEEAQQYLNDEYPDDEKEEETLLTFSGNHASITLDMTLEQAQSGAHQGSCDNDVMELSKVPAIAQQLAKLDPEALRLELKEYGAWDATELADHEQNLQRILWLACGQIKEENQ